MDDGDLKILLSTKEFFTVERKRYDDFASSYITKHLQDQAIRMNENCEHYCVIVHGGVHDLFRAADFNPALKKINRFSVEKMHQKMEMIYKCPCFFVDNEASPSWRRMLARAWKMAFLTLPAVVPSAWAISWYL